LSANGADNSNSQTITITQRQPPILGESNETTSDATISMFDNGVTFN
jgi:hypothetical protein